MADSKKYRKIRNKMTKDAVLRERAAMRDYERGVSEQAKLPRAKAGTGAKIQKRKAVVKTLKKVKDSKVSATSDMDKKLSELDKKARAPWTRMKGLGLVGGGGRR